MELFRSLTVEEKDSFRAWARENYVPFSEIKGFWHPSVQAECVLINSQAGQDFSTSALLKEF